LEEKVAAPVQKTENTVGGIRQADHVAPLYPEKLVLSSPTSGGHSVGIVRSRTKATEFSFYLIKQHATKKCGERGDIAPPFLTSALDKGVVSFKTQPIYPRGKNPRQPLDIRLAGPKSRPGRYGVQKRFSVRRELYPWPSVFLKSGNTYKTESK
jgi:hypothetical protein